MSQPCQNEKLIDVINGKVDRLENKIDSLAVKIDELNEYKYKQQGAAKVLLMIGSMVGAAVGFLMEKIIR